MGNLRIALLIILLSTTYTTQQDYPNRPTRTLGSFFGSSTKPSPSPPVPTPTRGANNNSPAAQTSKQVPGGGVRPLVYQVKYYERNNNGLVDYPVDSRNYVVDSKVVGAEPVQYVGAPVVPQPTTNRFVYYNPLIPPQTPPPSQPYGFYPTTPVEPYGYPYQQVSPYVLPCAHTQNPTDLIYENSVVPQTTVTMNMQPVVAQTQAQQQTPDKVVVPTPTIRAPVVEPQAQRYHHHPVPLVREQVVQAAAELSGAVPTTGVVGSGINAVPYGYYYYYYIPPLPPQQQYYRIQGSSQQQQQPSQYVPYVVSPYGQPVVQQQQVKTQQGSVVGQRVVGAQQVQQQQQQGQGVVKEQQK